MVTDLTFEDVCKLVENDDEYVIEQADRVLNILIVLSTTVAGFAGTLPPDALGWVASLIEVKNEAIRLSPQILDLLNHVTGIEEEKPYQHEQRMSAAYVLICYSAYFDTLEELLPELMSKVRLKGSEKVRLTERVQHHLEKRTEEDTPSVQNNTNIYFQLPHPTEDFQNIEKRLIPIYEKLTEGFKSFLECLVIWEESTKKQKEQISEILKMLPQEAIVRFRGQYYALAQIYNDFYVWASLHSHEETQQYIGQLGVQLGDSQKVIREDISSILDFLKDNSDKIDVGFNELGKLVKELPDKIATLDVKDALAVLTRRYKREVFDIRIIEDEYTGESDTPRLTYPKRSEIFIPQSYKYLKYTERGRLEDNRTWKQKSRQDLGSFLLSYLTSPYSRYTPLIILGHPGSGKSMLTRFIAAQLDSSWYTPIRIELRNINAELSIRDQVEEQIKKITGNEVKWGNLRRWFAGNPMVIIFDGYDELLQASGKKFSGYLREIEQFQEEAYLDHDQPVLAIVTSRITLIDQAAVPANSTVIRLEPFNQYQRNYWISIWNQINHQYFLDKAIEPFAIPTNSSKLRELAEQPLLLLMLALYDSEDNALQQHSDLNRTFLYNDLLRRFIRRELSKDDNYELNDELIEDDMKRLGAVAISMFNRRALDIRTEQLDSDLRYFGLERQIEDSPSTGGSELTQGELLFGSFFFVYKSETTLDGIVAQQDTKEQAYEFLHNTFGEFLTADFILRTIFDKVAAVHESHQSKRLAAQLPELLRNLSDDWYTTLIYTPLFSRPVVLEMMREWLENYEKEEGITREEFLASLHEIVNYQIERILSDREYPRVMLKNEKHSFDELPLIGHAAIYTINLMLVSTILAPNGYTFEQKDELTSADGTLPWDRLINLWRSWFSVERLSDITAILESAIFDTNVQLIAKEDFSTALSTSKLDKLINVSVALADQVNMSLFGLLTHNPYLNGNLVQLEKIKDIFERETIYDFQIDLLTRDLISLRGDVYIRLTEQIFEEMTTVLKTIVRSPDLVEAKPTTIANFFYEILLLIDNWPDYDQELFSVTRRSHRQSHSEYEYLTDLVFEALTNSKFLWKVRPDVVLRALEIADQSMTRQRIEFTERFVAEIFSNMEPGNYSFSLLIKAFEIGHRYPTRHSEKFFQSLDDMINGRFYNFTRHRKYGRLLIDILRNLRRNQVRPRDEDLYTRFAKAVVENPNLKVLLIDEPNPVLLLEFLKLANLHLLSNVFGDNIEIVIDRYFTDRRRYPLTLFIEILFEIDQNGYQVSRGIVADIISRQRDEFRHYFWHVESEQLAQIISHLRTINDAELIQYFYHQWLDNGLPDRKRKNSILDEMSKYSVQAVRELKWLAKNVGDEKMVNVIDKITTDVIDT